MELSRYRRGYNWFWGCQEVLNEITKRLALISIHSLEVLYLSHWSLWYLIFDNWESSSWPLMQEVITMYYHITNHFASRSFIAALSFLKNACSQSEAGKDIQVQLKSTFDCKEKRQSIVWAWSIIWLANRLTIEIHEGVAVNYCTRLHDQLTEVS